MTSLDIWGPLIPARRSDGVLTAAARKVVKEPLEQRSWIICDGDVDPEWIESLNSVLDDNRWGRLWLWGGGAALQS